MASIGDTGGDETPLSAAARRCGIEPRYWDIFGLEHVATPEALQAIMRSLGVEAEQPDDAEPLLPATLVIDRDDRTAPVNLPHSRTETVSLLLEFESGEQARFETRIEGGLLALPADLPLGYHNMHVHAAGRPVAMARVIVCPGRAYLPEWLHASRTGGLSVSLYALRSGRNWGCGDFTDLENLIRWAASDARVSFIGLNPLHSIPNRQPYNTSPYLPDSSFYRNLIYLDVERVEEFARSKRAQRLALPFQPGPDAGHVIGGELFDRGGDLLDCAHRRLAFRG